MAALSTACRHASYVVAVGIILFGWAAEAFGERAAEAVAAMKRSTSAPIMIEASPLTGYVSFLSASIGAPVPVLARKADPPETRAAAFLDAYGPAFGLADSHEVRAERVSGPDFLGRERVRYRQVHAGVPVTGGEVSVHLDGAGVVAVTAKTLQIEGHLDIVPALDAAGAVAVVEAIIGVRFPDWAVTLSEPELQVFNRGLLEGRKRPTRLAWFVEARGDDVRHFFWIDAHTGAWLLDFSQLAHALSRQVYTANSTSVLPGTLIRGEGAPATGDPDVDLAYDLSGDTYNYYLAEHGRDSFDGNGSAILSSVRYCTPTQCPLPNAFWNVTQVVYGAGFIADDLVAHEITHGVIDHSAKLFYFWQSGALNESYADIFSETIDLLNGRGNDTSSVRWIHGEDLPGGPARNMMNPNEFGDPGKISDPQFACLNVTSFQDNGGLHTNSGVANHAYALMVDGGTYNGYTITGIGLIKAGKIQYRALTTYLLAASDFLDNYNAIKQSCMDLLGIAGIAPGDCTQVGKALDAVEMAKPPICNVSVPYCPAGTVVSDVFFDDLENTASSNWAISTITGVNHWSYPPANPQAVVPTSGERNFWGEDKTARGHSVIAMTRSIAVPAGARFQFNHAFFFDNDLGCPCDGGVIEYSANDGATWTDAGTLISAGTPYGGTISNIFDNPLGGRPAFIGDTFDYRASQLNLASLVGQNVRFRFALGTDSSIGDMGWFIDDIRMYRCVPGPARLVNISTRGRVEGGDNVMIGGFVIQGSTLRRVLIRALGPSLAGFGVPGVLANPVLQIYSGATPIARNDDWQVIDPTCQASGYACGSPGEIAGMGLSPTNGLEGAILISLPPGAYTAIVSGAGGGTGVGLVEGYDVDDSPVVSSQVINISTRGRVGTGDHVMIGGFIVGGNQPKKLVVRAIGPSLANFGVPGVLADPVLRIFSGQTAIAQNDNWQVADPLCQSTGNTCGSPSEIAALGRAPSNLAESAIVITLPPGPYTAIVSGSGGATGVGLVEVFEVPQ